MIVTNRKSMWEQIVAKRDRYIGGTLIEAAVPFNLTTVALRTVIEDVALGDDYFRVKGEDFSCGGRLAYIGIVGESRFGKGLEIRGYGAHEWHMLEKE